MEHFSMPLLLWQLFILFAIIIPLLALVDIIRKPAKTNDKILWVVIILLSSLCGGLLWFLKGRKQIGIGESQ